MAKDKRVFTGGMDKDSDPRLIKNGDYRHAENIRNIASSDGTSGSVENIESTIKVPYSFKGEDVDKIIVIDEGTASVLPQKGVFYSQIISFEYQYYGEGWSNKEPNAFSIYSYTPDRSLEQIGHKWSSNGHLKWNYHSYTPTPEYLWGLFNEETGIISQNIPIIDINTGEWETAHSKVDFLPTQTIGGGRRVSVEIIADKQGVSFLLDFISPASEKYWSQTIEEFPPLGHLKCTGGPNSVIGTYLTLMSQSSFYSEDTNSQALDEFVDAEGNLIDNPVPTPLEGDTITEYRLSFEGEEPTSPQAANDLHIFSYVENDLGDFEVVPFLSLGGGLYDTGASYEFDSNQVSLSNSLHDAFDGFYGNVLHKGETAINGSIEGRNGQVSLSFLKGEALNGNNFSAVQNSANATVDDFNFLKGFYNSTSLGDYSSQVNIELSSGNITLTESSLSNNDSWKFPVELNKTQAYLVQGDIFDFNSSSAVLDITVPSALGGPDSIAPSASNSGLSISGVNNTFEWIIPASEIHNNASFIEIKFVSGSIDEGESISIRNFRVSELKRSSFEFDISLRSLTDFNLCFGSSEGQVLESLRGGLDLSDTSSFVDSFISAKLSLERKKGKDFSYVSDQLIEAQEKIVELNGVITSLNADLKSLKVSYNDTLEDINAVLPVNGNVAFTVFSELENQSAALASSIIDVTTQVDDFVSKVTVFQTPEQLAEIADLEASIANLEAEIAALNQASQVAAAQALIDIEAAREEGKASITPEDGVTQADVDAVQALLDVANNSLTAALADVDTYNDGVTQVHVDEVQALLDQAGIDIGVLETQVSDLTETEASLTAQLSAESAEVIRIQNLLDIAKANLTIADDNITQTDVDNAVAPIKTLLEQAQTTINAVDPNDGLADTVVDSFQDLITTALATLTTKKEELTGVFDSTQTSSDIDAINTSITTLQAEIVRLQGVETNQITKEDVTTAVTNLKDILVNASTVTLSESSLTSTDEATQALLDAISNQVTEASTIITDAITKIEQQKKDAVDDAVSGLYTLTQLNEEYIKAYIKGTTLVEPEGGASQADTDGKIAAAIADANLLIETGKDTSFAEGVASIIKEDGINQSHVDAAKTSGYADGAASVDITTDNQASYDAGVAAVQENPNAYSLYTQAQYEDNFTTGANSVNLTILGNPEIAQIAGEQYAAGVAATQELFNNDLTQLTPEQAENAGFVWAQGIRAGYFGEGVASVDITSDNQSVYDAAYADGEAAGAASVDLTTDNPVIKLISDSAFTTGANSVTKEDGISQTDVDAVQEKLDSLNSLIGALPVSYTDKDSITNSITAIETSVENVVAVKKSFTDSLLAAFNAGEASVDITTDNQGAIDTAVAEIDTALTNAKTDLKILEGDLTVITEGTKNALQSLLNEANTKITTAKDATTLVQADLDAIEASLSAANLLLDATVVKTDSETSEIINNTQASLDAVIAELADLKSQLFGFDAEKYANVQAQVNAAVAAAADTMYASVAAAVDTVVSILQPTTGIDISNVNQAVSVVLGTIDSVDGITQAEKDSAHAAAAASITSDDGITEAEVATALEAAVTDYSGAGTTFTSAQIKDAVRQIITVITPEDGITQADVDAVQTSLEAAISTLRAALGLSADATADSAANISALTTKITELNTAQTTLTGLQNSATGVDADFPTVANLISNYSSLKTSKIELEAKIADITALLGSATGTFAAGEGIDTLVPDAIQTAIEDLKTANSTLDALIVTTGSDIDSISSTVTTLYNNAQLVKEAKNYITLLINSTTQVDPETTGIGFDSTTNLYNDPTVDYGLEVGGVIGAIPQGLTDPLNFITSRDLYYLVERLRSTYNLLYDNYSALYADYTNLIDDPNTAVTQADVDAVQDSLTAAETAAGLANESLQLLYGNESSDNYIGNGSFDNNSTTGWSNLYGDTVGFWIVENEKLVRSPYEVQDFVGGASYTGSDASQDRRIIDGKYVISVTLKSLNKGEEFNSDSIFVTIGDTSGNFYVENFEVNGLGFATSSFTVEGIEADAFFTVGISFNGNTDLDFNLGIDDIQILKIPEQEYDQETLNALIYKLNLEQSILDYKHLIVTMGEQNVLNIEAAEEASYDSGYAEGAASVTPEDGVSQADVDAAVAAVDITTDNQAVADAAYADGAASVDVTTDNVSSFMPHLQRIALGLEGHPTPQIVDLTSVNTANYNWGEIKDLQHVELKDYIFTKIDNLIELSQFGGLNEETKNLIGALSINTQQYINNLKAENTILSENVSDLTTNLNAFVSFFAQSLLSIKNQNDGSISEYVETLSFASDYAGGTGILTDAEFLYNSQIYPAAVEGNINGRYGINQTNNINVSDFFGEWSVGDSIYLEDNTLLGVVSSVGTPDSNNISNIIFESNILATVFATNPLYTQRLDQLLTDGVAANPTLESGDVVHLSVNGEVKTIGEVDTIVNGPDVGSDSTQRLITFKENITFNILEDSEILFNALLNNLREEFDVRSTSIQGFIQDIFEQTKSLSNITEESQALKETYRFTLFGTPTAIIPALNDVGEVKLLLRNPDIPGYENWDEGNSVVTIVSSQKDYNTWGVNAPSTVLEDSDTFSNKGTITAGDGDEGPTSTFTYRIIPSDGDSLGTILKLKLLFGANSLVSGTPDISNLDTIDINGEDIERGCSFFVSVIKGSSANKWEFALSNDQEKSTVLNNAKVQWEIVDTEIEYTTVYKTTSSIPLVDGFNSDLTTVTNESTQSDWVINEHTDGESWAWNANGYYEGVNGGVVSPESGNEDGGFNQSNSLSLPIPELKANTTYEISFVQGTETDIYENTESYDDWAVPNLIDLQDIADFQTSAANSADNGFFELLGTYWSMEHNDKTTMKVGVFNYDGDVDVTTTASKVAFHRLRPVLVVENSPANARVVGRTFAGGVVYEVSGSTVKVVALADVFSDFAETINEEQEEVGTLLVTTGNTAQWYFENGSFFDGGEHSDRFQMRIPLNFANLPLDPNASSQRLDISEEFRFDYDYTSSDVKRFGGHFKATIDATNISTREELMNKVVTEINAGNYTSMFGLGPGDLSFGFDYVGSTPNESKLYGYQSFFHPEQSGTYTPAPPHAVQAEIVNGIVYISLASSHISPYDHTNTVTAGGQSEGQTTAHKRSTLFVSDLTTYGLTTESIGGNDVYIQVLPDQPDKHQFYTSGYYSDSTGFTQFYVSNSTIQFNNKLPATTPDLTQFSASDDQKLYASELESVGLLGWHARPFALCDSYTTSYSFESTYKFYDLSVSLSNGFEGSSHVENFLTEGFRGLASSLVLTHYSQFNDTSNSGEASNVMTNLIAWNYVRSEVLDIRTLDTTTLKLTTGPYYGEHITEGTGSLVITPGIFGFKGKFKGVQFKEIVQTPEEEEVSRKELKLLGEKIISAETHNVINQSPVYGTALINAYNGSKTLMKNNATGSVDVTPLIEGGYVCVGTYEDKPKNRIYYFVSEENKSDKRDSILEYDLMTDKITTVYQDDVGSSSGDPNAILTFSESHLITGINKVDDILYFTDNLNRPRKINVELAKANEENIKNCKFTFQDSYYNTFKSSVFIGPDNDHPFKEGDNIYTQYDSTSYLNACYNGYAKVLGIVPKLEEGVTIAINKGDTTAILSNEEHGLTSGNVGDFLAINDDTFPYYYKITSVSGTSIGLESPYNESNKTASKSLTFDGSNVAGIITDCPFGRSIAASQGRIFYANPKGAYSPLITFGDYKDKMKYFDVVKHQPTYKPSIEMAKDSSVATNNIIDNVFQFKYRYNHTDEENTAYSPISDVAIDGAYATNAPINAYDFNLVKNLINVSYDDAISDVEFIEIVGRKGNDGKFFLIESVPNNFIAYLKRLKNDLIILPHDNHEIKKSSIKFYNNGVYPFIDQADSNKLFDAVPIKAKAQTILPNNRLAYGNIVEGYDNVDLAVKTTFSSEEAPVLETQSSDISFNPTIPSGYRENSNGYDHKKGYGKATFNPTIDLSGLDLSSDKSQFLELDFNSVFKFETNGDWSNKHEHRSSNFYGAWRVTGITTAQELAEFVVGRVNDGDFIGGTSSGREPNNTNTSTVSASTTSSGLVTIRFAWTIPNSASAFGIEDTNLSFKSRTIAGRFTSGTVGVSSFKAGAFHNFGIAYFDETNRCSFVNTAPSYSGVKISESTVDENNRTIDLNGTRAYNPFYTEPGGPNLGQGSNVKLEIYNLAPDWAKYYQIYYTGNNTVDEFVQMTVTRAEHGAAGSGDDQMYFSLNALKGKDYSYNQTNNSQVEYNFVPGDRVRFISCIKDNARFKFNEYVDLEIAGEDLFQGSGNPIGNDTGYYIRVNDPKNDAVKVISNDGATTGTVDLSTTGSRNSVADSGYNGLIVEIYRPKKNSEEEFMVYYEVGDKYPVLSRHHGGDSTQAGNSSVDESSGVEVSEVPATVNINMGDIYLKPRTMFTSGSDNGSDAETFFPEDYNLNDFHDTNHYSRGRINVINTNSKARRLDASVYYSEPYSSTGSINGLSSFNLANQPYFDYNKGFGSIQSLQTKDDDLIIFHENKVGRVLVGKDVLNTASGDGLVSLSRDIIKNYVTVYSGEYGCCLQPESIVKANDTFYFMDIKKGAVLRLSNDGITPISDYGMKDYFRDIGEMYVEYDPETQDNQVFNIVAGFDPKYNEYIITLPAVYDKTEGLWDSDSKTWSAKSDRYSVVGPEKIFFAKTIAFNEDTDRWTSFYGFYPEFYSRINNQFVGFQAGYMFKHNMTDRYHQELYLNNPNAVKSNPNYNVCYDKVLDSSLEFPFNAEPDTVKNYNAISLNSDTKLFTEMKTNIGQTGVGASNYNGYDNVISTSIGFRKVKGEVESANGGFLVGNANPSLGEVCKFYEDLHKGDVIRIIGKKSLEDSKNFHSYAIVNSISSNNLLIIDRALDLAVVSHVEVIDYKTKEGVQHSQIPFVSSMGYSSETLGFNGDGSELSFIGLVNNFEYSQDNVFASVYISLAIDYSINEITPSQMITGATYALIEVGQNDGFNINNISSGVYGDYNNTYGEVFTCSSRSSSTSSRVVSITERAFIQNLNSGETVFVGYPFAVTPQGGGKTNSVKVSLSDQGKAFLSSNPTGNFALFLAKDGNIEGERLKGSYMMTTLTTKSPSSTSKSNLPKYKFNLYSASVDADKSELSGE